MLRRDPTWTEPPVILMSADADQPGIAATVESKTVIRFFRNPFDVDQIVRTVHEAAAESPAAP